MNQIGRLLAFMLVTYILWRIFLYFDSRYGKPKRDKEYKQSLITELDLILSSHLKVDYHEFFEMVNRIFPHSFDELPETDKLPSEQICGACGKLGGDPIHVGDRQAIIEFQDLEIPELEQLIRQYGILRVCDLNKKKDQ